MLRKTVGNWVDGDRFFNRKADLDELESRIRDGTHTLLTAQRRMGKTSLVRELLRRLGQTDGAGCLFVDLEDARDPADAVVAIGLQSKSMQPVWHRFKEMAANSLQGVEDIQVSELRIGLRAAINAGNWKQEGDALLKALAGHDQPVVLAIDELPLLVNRILNGRDYRMTPERIDAADEFLSWLRRNGQAHRGRIRLIVSGSVGIAPILKRAGLSATMNIFSAYCLSPWDQSTASECLAELAETYSIDLPPSVRGAMCRRLRSCIPHHVQQFFDALHRHLTLRGRRAATLSDAETAYREDMLGTRGRIDMDHYEERLKLVLGIDGYRVALELLARTASEGLLHKQAIQAFGQTLASLGDGGADQIPHVLDVLEHDGYLGMQSEGYRFESGLLEDWQRAREGLPFLPFTQDQART